MAASPESPLAGKIAGDFIFLTVSKRVQERTRVSGATNRR